MKYLDRERNSPFYSPMAEANYLQVDVEATNRCNAGCYFCPRDRTPHQGSMSRATFEQLLARLVELRAWAEERLGLATRVSLCGLGEPLLHPHLADLVSELSRQGFGPYLATNASLLGESRAQELLDAGLARVDINACETEADYEKVYRLPWERTFQNVVRFVELARGRCLVSVVLVNHRGDAGHQQRMMRFWQERGVQQFMPFEINNRGGALSVDYMQYAESPEFARARSLLDSAGRLPVCAVPFSYLFVGYDGNYYLCCNDWTKEVPLGHLSSASFAEVMPAKFERVTSREPVCRSCNHEPLNKVVDVLRAIGRDEARAQDLDATLAALRLGDAVALDIVRRLGLPRGAKATREHV